MLQSRRTQITSLREKLSVFQSQVIAMLNYEKQELDADPSNVNVQGTHAALLKVEESLQSADTWLVAVDQFPDSTAPPFTTT